MRKRNKGISRLEIVIWLLCAVAVSAAALGVRNASTYRDIWAKVTSVLTPGSPPFSNDLTTILLIGVDERRRDVGRADTIILIWVNPRDQRAAMLSIPRDTWCWVGKEETKIAHSYSGRGSWGVVRAVEGLLGDNIDYYVRVDFEGIQRIVNAMGGVEIDVERPMHYTDRRGKLFINLEPGRQRLDGYNAMCYVRFRHDRDSDFGRMRRQKEFLLAAFRQLQQRHGLTEIANIAYQSWRNLDTNLSSTQMRWLAQNMKDLDFDDVKMDSLAVTEGHAGGMSVLIPKIQEDKQMAWEMRRRAAGGALLDKRLIKVQVLNGTKLRGKALSAAEAVKGLGFQVVGVGNADNFNYQASKVFATPDGKSWAKELAASLGIEKVFDKADQGHRLSDPDIFLIVGDDWTGSAAKAGSASGTGSQ